MAAALVGVAAAQLANQTQTFAVAANGQVEPPCLTGEFNAVPPYFVNGTTSESHYQNGTIAGNGWNDAGSGYNQNKNTNSYGEQFQNQPRWGSGVCGFGGYR